MRKLTNIRSHDNEFADITGVQTYQAFSPTDNQTYNFDWPIDEPAPNDGVILHTVSLTVAKRIIK